MGMARLFKVVVAASVVAVGLSWPVSTSAAAGGWTQRSAATPADGGGLSAVSCVSTTFCEAVGFQAMNSSASRVGALAEHWTGSSVRTQSDPVGHAFGVSCAGRDFCVEVGYTHTAANGYSTATAAQWDGMHWTAMKLPSVHYSALEAVSCWSSSGCVSVGQYFPASYAAPLVMRWDGSSWRVQKAPTGSGFANHLSGVSCVSGSSCVSVGQTFLDAQGRYSRTLAEAWDGHGWQTVSTPTLSKAYQPTLAAVSCVTVHYCVAVGGGAAGRSLILRWDGSQFARETPASPQNPSAEPTLAGVSCPTATFCVATGMLPFTGFRAERWDGSSWTMATMPPGGGSNDFFESMSVACPTAKMCLAAGDHNHQGHDNVVVDEWTGP